MTQTQRERVVRLGGGRRVGAVGAEASSPGAFRVPSSAVQIQNGWMLSLLLVGIDAGNGRAY